MGKLNKKLKIFLYIFFGALLLAFLLKIYFGRDTTKNYVYSIATLSEVEYVGRSATNRIVFKYDKFQKKGTYRFANDSTTYYKSQIGKRFLVKMNDKPWVNKLFFTYHLYVNKPVPDSIKEAPSGGWRELPEWAK